MAAETADLLWNLMGTLFKAHPWHGVRVGDEAPHEITCFIEMTPTDTVKYEIDKTTGHLLLDRPQRYSNVCPALYGFVPQTYSAARVAQLCKDSTGRDDIIGDSDPVDVCVLTEKHISHGEILLTAIPIGGFRMIDDEEADDKLIAVLKGDAAYGMMRDISEVPAQLIDRLKHYFLTYKKGPDQQHNACVIDEVYGREVAHQVLRAGMEDYKQQFGNLTQLVTTALRE